MVSGKEWLVIFSINYLKLCPPNLKPGEKFGGNLRDDSRYRIPSLASFCNIFFLI